jgi:transposase
MHTHSLNKSKEFKQTSACQKADDNCFLGQERSVDGGIHATRDHNVTSILQNTKKMLWAIQNKRRGMLTYGVVLLHDNARPHTAARTRAQLEHFNWELSDHPPLSPDRVPSEYHLFTYLKNWLGSEHFNNNEELMEGVKTWLRSRVADFDTGIQELIP